MGLIPVTIFGGQFTSAEVTFLQAIADHSYTDGQLIIGNSSGNGVAFSTLTAGSGITITNGHGTISIAASAASAPFADTTAIVYNAADNTKQVKFSAASITTGTTRTITVPDVNGTMTVLGNTTTGSGSIVLATSPSLTTPTLGVASATTINKVTLTTPATGSTLTVADGKTLTASVTMTLQGGDSSVLSIAASKTLTVSNTLTFTGTDASSVAFGGGGTVAYTANNLSVFAATTSAQLAGVISDETGSGALVFATSPSLTTPTLGVASATTINKVTITAPATGSTLTIADGKTLSISNTLTFTGTDGSSVAFGAGGTVLYSGGALGTPSSGTLTSCTGLPVSGITASTTTALGVGSIELGHASDTTIARVSAGVASIEGVNIVTVSSTDTMSNKTLTAPKFADAGYIADNNGNEQIKFSTTASAVNEFTVKNAATGGAPDLQATGGDTNIDIKLTPKGSGKVAPQSSVNFGAKTAYFTETDNGNSSTADTIDWTVSNKQKSTLTGNCTFTFTAPPGPCSLILKLVQDGTGSRTVTWPAAVHWSGGTAPTLTTTASKVDIISFYFDGTTYFGTSSLNYTA